MLNAYLIRCLAIAFFCLLSTHFLRLIIANNMAQVVVGTHPIYKKKRKKKIISISLTCKAHFAMPNEKLKLTGDFWHMTTLTASQFYFISKQFFKVFGKHAILPLFMRFGLAAIFIQFSFGFRLLFLLYLRHECLLLEGNKVTATTSCHAHPAPPAASCFRLPSSDIPL